MFTGIIEEMGVVVAIQLEKDNVNFTIEAAFTDQLKVDQSVAHNGCCLTVVDIDKANSSYVVTAIKETLSVTNLSNWKVGTKVNLERSMLMNGRIDGHIVQGHVDCVATCTKVLEENGSWKYDFSHQSKEITVEKGSITINGTSLTVVNSDKDSFSVCIIPYTYHNTNFHEMKLGDTVNLEFDVIGKYVSKWLSVTKSN
ncbi:MAG: riboflavin synthase [Crocinitomicaceae bacterium]|jgi:riboflavin synthase|nr:riboflavin synthase [Crocinitomicaceae bacterium]